MPPRAMAFGDAHTMAPNRPVTAAAASLAPCPDCGPGRLRGPQADDPGGNRDVAQHHDGENDAEQEREPAQPPPRGQGNGNGQRQADAGAPAGDRPDVRARLVEAGSQVRGTGL